MQVIAKDFSMDSRFSMKKYLCQSLICDILKLYSTYYHYLVIFYYLCMNFPKLEHMINQFNLDQNVADGRCRFFFKGIQA
jgi:hypothetical protein